jgi:hypothetical protein
VTVLVIAADRQPMSASMAQRMGSGSVGHASQINRAQTKRPEANAPGRNCGRWLAARVIIIHCRSPDASGRLEIVGIVELISGNQPAKSERPATRHDQYPRTLWSSFTLLSSLTASLMT